MMPAVSARNSPFLRVSNAFICAYPHLFFHLQGGCDVLLVIHGCDQLLERLAGKEHSTWGTVWIYCDRLMTEES